MKKNEEKVEENVKEPSELEAKLEKANADMEYWKNQYYKAYADMANLRKEIERDHREAIKYRLEDFADSLLGVLDAFDIAFKTQPSNPETANYLKGFEFVYKQLLQVLENEGINTIEPIVGGKFDETTMHAVGTVEDEGEEGIIKQVQLKGYKLYDHLIRASMVIVTKKPENKEENVDNNQQNAE
jgi:molecular chaperone GrpE